MIRVVIMVGHRVTSTDFWYPLFALPCSESQRLYLCVHFERPFWMLFPCEIYYIFTSFTYCNNTHCTTFTSIFIIKLMYMLLMKTETIFTNSSECMNDSTISDFSGRLIFCRNKKQFQLFLQRLGHRQFAMNTTLHASSN